MSFGQDRTVKVNLKATVSDYIGKITAAQKATRDFSKAAADSAKKNKQDWTDVGTKVALAGAAIGVGVGFAVKTFMEFDSAMSAASAATTETGAALDSLRAAAIKSGADTMFSATEAANAITEMGKAGVGTRDILSGGLTGAMDLAAAGSLDVGRAAEIAATALNQFNLKGADLPHVADLFSAAAGKAQGSVEDVAMAMSFVGPVAAAMGISIEDATATIGLMAQQGITGEKAGTGFRGMLLSLVAPSKIAKGAMDDLGVNMYDNAGKFVGMQGAAGELQAKLSGLDEQTRNTALGQIFGNESLTSAIALYKGGAAGVEAWRGKVNDAGFASEQAAKLTDNLRGDIERLGGSIDTVLIQGASGANAPLRGLTQGLEDTVNAFGSLGPAGSGAVFNLAAVTAGVALLGGGALIAVPKVIAFNASLATLEATALRTSIALKTAYAAFLLFGVYEGATILANWSANASVATVATDQLTFAMVNLNDAASNKDFVDLFNGKGFDPQDIVSFAGNFVGLSDDVTTADEALKRFGKQAYQALDQGVDAAGARFFAFGGKTSAFNKTVTQLDTSLAAMVAGGNVPQAAKDYDLFTKAAVDAGVPLSSITRQFTKYQGALTALSDPSKKVISATDELALKAAEASDAMVAGGGNASSYGSAVALLGAAADAAKDQVKELAKTIQGDMDKAASAFAGSTDVLGKYDPKAAAEKSKAAAEAVTAAEENASNVRERIAGKKKKTIADGQAIEKADAAVSKAKTEAGVARAQQGSAGLEASYKASIIAGKTFVADIAEVTKRGLDPAVVAKLLQEGPEKAAPALETLLGSHSKKMIAMVNGSEASLAAINARVVEQARLTSMAVNGTSDQMTTDLTTGLAIAAAKVAAGGKITADKLAEQLKIGVPEVQRIAAEFGIGLASGFDPALAKIDELQRRMDGTLRNPVVIPISLSGIDAALADANRLWSLINPGAAIPSPVRPIPNQLTPASGGYVTGAGSTTSDSIPAMLSNKEYVNDAATVKYYGVDFFDDLKRRRFATGGYVGGGSGSSVNNRTYDQPVNIAHAIFTDGRDLRAEAAERRQKALRAT